MNEATGWTRPIFSELRIVRRNYGHWDIWDERGRILAVRGGPGDYYVRDERDAFKQWPHFKTLSMLMACVCEDLMYENLKVQGREPLEIESWNFQPQRRAK